MLTRVLAAALSSSEPVRTTMTASAWEANVIGFTKDGTEHRLRIPEGTKFADAEKLLNDGQFEELFKFESVAI
ncbi:hypothetical protein NLJ89_g5863 [Agrocybe chaxingu]|uniref:Uncharacterized protein n=1 Tax=Agrocybe chaxingu TaxID=84603 RepID=A0A9W8JZF5_9AGAR|nr:hypothetical protein NLJ89_g5863 [Agrocybe chaxingu]